jgi:hypothetical protein
MLPESDAPFKHSHSIRVTRRSPLRKLLAASGGAEDKSYRGFILPNTPKGNHVSVAERSIFQNSST